MKTLADSNTQIDNKAKDLFVEELLNCRSHLETYARSLTYNINDAKDLVQDTLIKALSNRDKFEYSTSMKAWTFTIMKNTFINNYNRRAKTNKIIDSSKDLTVHQINYKNNYYNPESLIHEEEIRKNINRLEKEQRIPFEMFTNGFKYKEIAEELDLSIGTVKSRIFFGRKKMMESLKDFN